MHELADRLRRSARHLSLVDTIASETYGEYARMREKLVAIPGYKKLARQLYYGQERRQMMLGDILLYILTGRGFWVAVEDVEGFRQFVRILLYTANLLLIQETLLSARPAERRRFLARLRSAKIGRFFASEKERREYEELMAFRGRITVREPRSLYKVMDSVLPRTPGMVLELIVYVQLLVKRLGYSVPLLVLQRLFRGQETLAPPDYLLLRPEGNVFGIEVGNGIGQFSLTQGKVDQINRFTQDTSIPVITATVPHLYRCAACDGWITFCDSVIERTAVGDIPSESMSALDCPQHGPNPCENAVYYGRLAANGKRLRYHYSHLTRNRYVQQVLRNEEVRRRKLLHYFPYVNGLERLSEIPVLPPPGRR